MTEIRSTDSRCPHNAGRDTLKQRHAAHTTPGSLLGRCVLNGMNTDGLLALGVSGTDSASAVHVDLGVCLRGSGTHRDPREPFQCHGVRKYKKGAGEMAQVPLSLGL